jgi:hypothetical protein
LKAMTTLQVSGDLRQALAGSRIVFEWVKD